MQLKMGNEAKGNEGERRGGGEDATSGGGGCHEREQQNPDSVRKIKLKNLKEMGFEDTSENIRVLTKCKVPDSLY